ncbi:MULTISPECIES: hypothetical protein [Exiguobacterium]|uniref:hypothetical protein n=1 Tax=Exiguobacterium TaxID=33986 RepID=UPI001BE5AB83|nr:MULTISPECIES: hypothetical protein [Exiguobacterium]MCT4784539.1 hypothetical protein [Exiguobacterium himgiriensis]
MNWSTRMLSVLVLTTCLVIGFVFLTQTLFSWFQTFENPVGPPSMEQRSQEESQGKSGIEIGRSPTDKKGEGIYEKEDMLKFTFGSGKEETSGGLGAIFALLALGILVLYSVRRFRQRRRKIGLTLPTIDEIARPRKLHVVDASLVPMLTNITLRDWLITFNASLPTPLKLRANETLHEWFERIDLTDIDTSLYHLIRYGVPTEQEVSLEQQEAFHQALLRYAARHS